MPTVDDLLNNTIESQVCTIDPDTRVINVPACYKEFGVEADEKVNRIQFQCPKMVGDNIDLTTFNLYINYMNARGEYNAYLVDDVTVSGDDITFSWVLSRHVTEKSGTVNYIVCAKKSDETGVINEWNTKVATATVGVGLEATTEIEAQNADVIEQILAKLNSVKNDAITYTEQDLSYEQKAQARANIGAQDVQVATAYYMWVNNPKHTNDIYSIAGTGASIGIISGEGNGGIDSDGNGLATPVLVIFGSISRGYVDALAISRLGSMYRTTLNLMSNPEPVWHKIKNLTLNDDSTLSQQIMSADPTEDMHIATKKYIDATVKSIPSGSNISLNVIGATVGQTVKISAVDVNGVPTAWVPVDMASGGGETWEKIADVALTADVSSYQLADFGTYRKVKALISRDTYVSGLNKNVWFRVSSTEQKTNTIAAAYVVGEYGYVALEINAEMGDMFTHVGVLSTNNRASQQNDRRTIDVVSPANPSAYGLYMVFVDTSVIQSGDTVTVYGVKR